MRILCIEPVTNGLKYTLIFFIVVAFIIALVWFCTEMSEKNSLWKCIVSGVISLALLVGGILIVFLSPNYIPNKYRYHVEIMDYGEVEEQLKDFNVTETHGNLAILEDK